MLCEILGIILAVLIIVAFGIVGSVIGGGYGRIIH
jgi:hypothetical protein